LGVVKRSGIPFEGHRFLGYGQADAARLPAALASAESSALRKHMTMPGSEYACRAS
jgi:hypothetical protein